MNVIQVLTKLGYTISSINEDILPATISKDGKPLGFLLSDLSTTLVDNDVELKKGIDNAVEFAKTYNGLEVLNDEFKLSAYENTVITVAFDFDNMKEVFNVYSVSNDEYTLINSSYEKSQATNFFVKASGLTNPQVTENKQVGRINAFVEQIKKLGYTVTHAKEPNKIYTITDRDNNEVGYINSQYRFTLSTDTIATRRELNQAFDVTSPNKSLSPPFFERLKQALTQLKLSLKIIFTRQGEKYVINDSHTRIATIDEDKNIQFADKVSIKTKEKLTEIISDVKAELSKPLEVDTPVPVLDNVQNTTLPITNEAPIVGNVGLTFEEMTEIITAIISNEQIANLLPQSILQKLNVQGNINNEKEIIPQEEIAQITSPVHEPLQDGAGLSNAQQEIFNSFSEHYNYLMTVKGFNQDEYVKVEKIMVQKFGTIDLSDFNYKLLNDKLPKNELPKPTLEQKLSTAKEKAARINNSRKPEENKDISSKEIVKE